MEGPAPERVETIHESGGIAAIIKPFLTLADELADALGNGKLIVSPADAPIEEERRADIDQARDDINFLDDKINECLESESQLPEGKKDIKKISYTPKLRYFLDGSLRTKYLGDYMYIKDDEHYSTPILASEVATSVVRIEGGSFGLERLERKLVLIFPHKESGLIPDTLFEKLKNLNNSWSKMSALGMKFEIKFLGKESEEIRDIRYSMLGKARDVMHDLELDVAREITRDEDRWLVMDGALRKSEFEQLTYTIGLAKSFSKKPRFRWRGRILDIVGYLSRLREGERSAVFKIGPKGEEGLCFWYVRLRERPPMEPLDGLVKVDYKCEGSELSSNEVELIDELSSEIYALRSPSVYPYPRWPSYIYPIRLAEEFMRPFFINTTLISLIGRRVAEILRKKGEGM